MNEKSDTVRLDYLDGLRALAALAVIFTHAFFAFGTEPRIEEQQACCTTCYSGMLPSSSF